MRLVFLSLLIVLGACGDGKRLRTLEVSHGFLSASQPTMVYGQQVNGPETFALKLEAASTKIELANGDWKFQSITWASGTNPMEGTPKCAETTSTLKSDSVTVQLNMTSVGCKSASWMGNSGYYDMPPMMFFGLSLNFCQHGVGDPTLSAYTDCTSYANSMTGFKVVLPDFTNGKTGSGGMESICYPVTSNSINASARIPFGTSSTFPVYSVVKTFYSQDSSCSGSGCCSGKEVAYDFPHGFGQGSSAFRSNSPVMSSNIKLKIEEKSLLNIFVYTTPPVAYNACNPVYYEFRDEVLNPYPLPSALTVNFDCQGLCTFHTDPSCVAAAITSVPMGPGGTSGMLYVKQSEYTAKIKVSASNNSLAPGLLTVPSTVTYATIDGNYLFGPANLSALSSTNFSPPIAASTTVAYETRDGNRGKMRINSVSMVSVPGDTFNFDFETYNSAGTLIASGTNQTITACFSGNCMLDLDSNTPVFSGGNPQNDAWFENLSGSLYFNPQATAQFFVLP